VLFVQNARRERFNGIPIKDRYGALHYNWTAVHAFVYNGAARHLQITAAAGSENS
jgi:hypothetical protein